MPKTKLQSKIKHPCWQTIFVWAASFFMVVSFAKLGYGEASELRNTQWELSCQKIAGSEDYVQLIMTFWAEKYQVSGGYFRDTHCLDQKQAVLEQGSYTVDSALQFGTELDITRESPEYALLFRLFKVEIVNGKSTLVMSSDADDHAQRLKRFTGSEPRWQKK